MTSYETKKRRAWQVLHGHLDKHILPILPTNIVLAISGGPDSRALLESIALWPHRMRAQWLVVSIDHGMRAQSVDEAKLVSYRAKRLGFSTHIDTFVANAKDNEQSLRNKRYDVLKEASKSIDSPYICCAHHRDDNAEGFLMALLGVGGGALGAAMPTQEQIGSHIILRPFIELAKDDLLLPLSLSGYTDFALDNHDQEREGQRAFLRHEIMPKLRAHSPKVAARLDYFARQQRLRKNALAHLASPLISWGEQSAIISLLPTPEPVLLEMALRTVMQKMSSHLDLRQCRPTLEKIIRHVLAPPFVKPKPEPGLDRPSKLFILKDLKAKVYQLPGVEAYANGKEIVIRRV